MINGGDVEDGVAKPPARRQVAEWITGAYKSVTKQTAKNAWKKMVEIFIIVIITVTFGYNY